jgi:hypothetical protein
MMVKAGHRQPALHSATRVAFFVSGVRRIDVIVPQDEFMLQSMLGVDTIPDDILDEYLKRVRYLHKATSGGPVGAGMLVDMLRFLGHEPVVGAAKASGAQVDWRNIKIGTRVNVRRAGRWSLASTVCRFAGFVDMGTLAVELPGGRVDEFMRFDVRIAVDDIPSELHRESFDHKDGLQDVRLEQNAMTELLDAKRPPEDDIVSVEAEPGLLETPVFLESAEESTEELTEEIVGEGAEAPEYELPPAPAVDWKEVPKESAVYARIVAPDGEVELHDAIFKRRLKNGKIVVVVNGEETERFLLPDACQLP